MRVAIFSDVHGNVAALDAVLAAIDLLNVDHTFALGDLVGRGPEPEAVVKRIRKRAIQWIRGNWDEWIAGDPGWDERPKRKVYVEASRALLSNRSLKWLREAPSTLAIEVDGVKFVLAHGSPRNPIEHLGPDTSMETLREAIRGQDAHVVVVGHSHLPFVRDVDGVLVANVGTVGYAFDGDPRARFVVVETSPLRASIVHVPYDLAKNVRALDRIVARRTLPEKHASIYRRALLGEGDALAGPAAIDARGRDGVLRVVAEVVQRALGGDADLEHHRRLRGALEIVLAALPVAKARRLRARLTRAIALLEAIDACARRKGALARMGSISLSARMEIRQRRLERRLEARWSPDRRVRWGLELLASAMCVENDGLTVEMMIGQALRRARVRTKRSRAPELRLRAIGTWLDIVRVASRSGARTVGGTALDALEVMISDHQDNLEVARLLGSRRALRLTPVEDERALLERGRGRLIEGAVSRRQAIRDAMIELERKARQNV